MRWPLVEPLRTRVREGPLALKFALVSGLGFATDAAVLHLLMAAGVVPQWARIASLFCAMQVTFLVNGLFVFRCLDRARPWRQWATYMVAHGFGNFCNYWIFLTLISLHKPLLSAPLFALAIGSVLAWAINYAAARFVVFRKVGVIRPLSPGAKRGRERA